MAGIIEEIVSLQQRRSHNEYALGGVSAAPRTVVELEEALGAAERSEMLAEGSKQTKGGIVYPNKKLGVAMHNWHGGMGDPIYGVGSLIFAGRPVQKGDVEDAIDNLEDLLDDSTGSEKKELQQIISALKKGLKEDTDHYLARPLSPDALSIEGEDVSILQALAAVESRTLHVPVIAEATGLDKSVVRRELSVMSQAGLVARLHPSSDAWRVTHFGEACASHSKKKKKKAKPVQESKFKLKEILDTHKGVKNPKKEAQMLGAMVAERGYESEVIKYKGGWLMLADDGRGILFLGESLDEGVGRSLKIRGESYKVVKSYPTKGDADGPFPKGLVKLIKKGGGAALLKLKSDYYFLSIGKDGKPDGYPVWLKPAQYKRAMSYLGEARSFQKKKN